MDNTPAGIQTQRPTELFTVRIWREPLGGGREEWRGSVQHVLTGESIYFRDWTHLVAFLVDRAGVESEHDDADPGLPDEP